MVFKMRRSKYTKKIWKSIGWFIKKVAVLTAIFFFTVAGSFFIWFANLKIPDFNAFESRKVSQSTKIYDRTGKILLYDIHQNIKRTLVPFEDISKDVKNAAVAIEDSEFYNHKGIKIDAIARAVYMNLTSGFGAQGGSTITQQVVKNTLLTQEKSITRKIKEWVLALKLEKVMTKEQILELYLNESPYGGTIYGVEEASQRFFGKNAKEVTLAEAAYLAALPQAPTFFSPYGSNKNKLDERKNIVLSRMAELGFITQTEAEEAKNEEVIFIPRANTEGMKAPHFVEYVRSYLERKYGKEELETAGLNVITTIDYDLQTEAEKVVEEYGNINEEKFEAKNAGMVAIDPKTGQILVMVGSRDYFDIENEGNFNVALGKRQPGSSFKPFVYAAAFNKGYTPETVLFDLETEFQTTCTPDGEPIIPGEDKSECYMPKNYDDRFRGPISLRDALAQSINIPAIKVLYLVGINDAIKLAREMGITGLTDSRQYGLTLVLGGGETTLLDMTSAYSVFANDGIKNPNTPILKITDSSGKLLEEFSNNERRVLKENVARQISSILSDNEAKRPAYGEVSPVIFNDKQVASKTGTTNDTRDAWVVGYTPNFALGVWVGNNDNTPMVKKVAGMITAPMWRAFMDKALLKIPEEKFKNPTQENQDKLKPVLKGNWKGGIEYIIDKASGKLATEHTPEELREKRTLAQIHSILYWVNKNDPLGERPKSPETDPQFFLWETPIRRWAMLQGFIDEPDGIIPTQTDDIHGPNFAPKFNIITPDSSRVYSLNEQITVIFQTYEYKFPVAQADFFLNNNYIGSSNTFPFTFSFYPSDTPEIKEINELKVVVYDGVRNQNEKTILFKVAI